MIIKVKANGSESNAVLTTPPTVAVFRGTHGAAYGVGANTQIRVNGAAASDSYTLRDGDVVEFYQSTSTKAASYRVKLSANGQSQDFQLDAVKTGNQLLADAGIRSALGVSPSSGVRVNGGSKSADSGLSDGDRVEFVQTTSTKAA